MTTCALCENGLLVEGRLDEYVLCLRDIGISINIMKFLKAHLVGKMAMKQGLAFHIVHR